MRDNYVTSRGYLTRTMFTFLRIIVIGCIILTINIIALNCNLGEQSNQITKLTEENQELRDNIKSLNDEITTMRETLDDLRVANMNIQSKLSDMDILVSGINDALFNIASEHKKFKDDMNEIKTLTTTYQDSRKISEFVFDPNDITKLSNLSVDELKIITPGTRFVGYEEELLGLEKEYNVNVIFAMANSIQECGWLETTSYTVQNNYFGLKGRDPFDSMYDCLKYYFYLIDVHYVNKRGLSTIVDIQPVYCPDDETWDEDITRIGNVLINKLKVTVE